MNECVFSIISLMVYCLTAKSEDPLIVNFGGIFEDTEMLQKIAFAHAVDGLNDNRLQIEPPVKFVPAVFTIPMVDSYKVFQKACDLMLSRVVAIFGPSSEPGTSQLRATCDANEIPHVTTASDFFSDATSWRSFSLNLFPPSRTVGASIGALIKYYDWKSFVLLYQDEDGLLQLQDLVHMSSEADNAPIVRTRQIGKKIQIGDRIDYKPLLKDIKEIINELHIVVQADLETSRLIMEQAKDMDMTNEYYHYIFTNLDLYTLDFEIYKQFGCNVTTVSLVNMQFEKTQNWIRDLRAAINQERHPPMLPRYGVQTQLAVIYDSVHLIAQGVKNLRSSLVPLSINCLNDGIWTNGSSFLNFLKTINFEGTTGKIQFDSQRGTRTNFSLNVMELSKTGFETLGTWNDSSGLEITKNFTKSFLEAEENLENQMLRVVVLLEEPFVMKNKSTENLVGNKRYFGFCIDLLDEIASLKKFNFTIHEVTDVAYGVKDTVTQKWNGMVGELMNKKADLAVSAFTINYGRSEVIDFTAPFMHLGISILFRKPKTPEPGLFSFLSPLSLHVWIYMLAAYIVVSLMLWLLARFSPYEWYNPHPCNPDNDVVENQFNLLNSFWFTVGSLMQQGSDLAPKATSTRLVAGVWWFFTLILISSYTANLAAFLTVERMVPQFNGADDLIKQNKIKYGSLNRGSTMAFFKESKIPTYSKMWETMKANPSVFASTTHEGIAKVLDDDYAFLMESAMIEYYTERTCELMQIGGQLDSKDSPYRESISQAVLQLQENTKLTLLKERWWKQKRCASENAASGQASELGLKHVGGVFVLLLAGLSAALIIGVIEFVYKSSQTSDENKQPLLRAMWHEVRFALQCKEEKHSKKSKTTSSPIVGYVDDGHGTLVPSYGFGYMAVPTRSESGLPKFDDV